MESIKYVSDKFLDDFKTNFEHKYEDFYRNEDIKSIKNIFNDSRNVVESSTKFKYEELKNEDKNENFAIENIKRIWRSLGHISIEEAENEKMWVALENTYYLNYHMNQLKKYGSIKGATVFTQGRKRSLFMNNIAMLWWLAYYTIDKENPNNQFHLTEFIVRKPYRGDIIALFSSNITANKNIILGMLDGIKELSDKKIIEVNRYAYTNSNKILNQICGVKILDMLSRNEIKEIVINNLENTKNIKKIK